jgi:four helix bundle protein
VKKTMIRTFKDLLVWQKSYEVCLKIYRVSKDFPRIEQYGITPQMRRAALSVPSNIAEGCGRKGTKEFIQALYIAYGSNCELETQIMIARDLNFIDSRKAAELIADIASVERMLKALIKSLEAKV